MGRVILDRSYNKWNLIYGWSEGEGNGEEEGEFKG